MSASVFQNMAPNAKKSFVVTMLFGAAAVGIYMFGVQPAEDALLKARKEHDDEESRLQLVNTNLRGAPENKSRLEKLAADLKPFREAMLEPLLGSYAMRSRTSTTPRRRRGPFRCRGRRRSSSTCAGPYASPRAAATWAPYRS